MFVSKKAGAPPKTASGEEQSQTSVTSSLAKKVPSQLEVNVPSLSKSPTKGLIEKANSQIQNNILSIVEKNEAARLNRQKPVLKAVLWFVGIQMVFFNVIIGGLVAYCTLHPSNGVFPLIFDFLKYYTGAVLVEMIGMIVFITKSTFTSSTKDLIQGIATTFKGTKD